jgi:predicted GTPase
VTGRFIENYDPPIENTLRKSVEFRGSPFSVEIVDTAGIGNQAKHPIISIY